MNITDFRNVILDTINRPADEVWISRVEGFIVQSFNRLSQKLLFEPLQVNIHQVDLVENMLDDDKKALSFSVAKPYIQSIYSEKLGQFLTVEIVNTWPIKFAWEPKTIYRIGTTYYVHKYLLGSKLYFFYTLQERIESANEIDNFEAFSLEFFHNAFDFIYYDVLVKLSNLMGNDLEKAQFYKGLRDEAYVDFASWANSIGDRGTLQIQG